jgi:hypothetical protein
MVRRRRRDPSFVHQFALVHPLLGELAPIICLTVRRDVHGDICVVREVNETDVLCRVGVFGCNLRPRIRCRSPCAAGADVVVVVDGIVVANQGRVDANASKGTGTVRTLHVHERPHRDAERNV